MPYFIAKFYFNYKYIVVCIMFAVYLFLPIDNLLAAESYVAPNLNVDIPGLNKEDFRVTEGLGVVSVPFLAVYIYAFFKYIVGVGLIATAIMIVYGGYLYLLGSTGLKVADGKEKIKEALMGMIILLGAYVILVNLNPNSITLQSLNIIKIPTDREIYQVISQNEGATAPEGVDAYNTPIIPDPPAELVKPIVTGKCRAIMAIEKDKLYQNITAQLKGNNFRSRIRQAAELFQDCKINLGYCGRVVEVTWAVAGVGELDGLLDPKKKFSQVGNFIEAKGVSQQDKTWVFGRYCGVYNKCLDVAQSLRNKGKIESAAVWEQYARGSGDCGATPNDAKSLVRQKYQASYTDYPKSFTDAIEVGDWLETYSANSECDGLHSQLFLGWHESKPGVAWIFDGSVKQNPRIRERCFDKRCSINYHIITKIYRPREDKLREGIVY